MTENNNLSVDEAIATILENVFPIGTERVPLPKILSRVLAEDISSKREHPPWNNSAMDGYAVKWADIQDATLNSPIALKVIGEVQAGGMAAFPVNRGEAIQIMTGAPVPDGADSVVRVEDTERSDSTVYILKPCQQGGNIRLKGEDVRTGDRVIPKGAFCRPAEIGMSATAGIVWGQVYQKPRISVLATGDELAEPGDILAPEKIINSNTFSIAAQVTESGGVPIILEAARDTKSDLESKILQAFSADIAIIVGGVSVGKYDYVKDVLIELGCNMKFWRVKMRPGHPVAFGVISMTGRQGDRPRLLFGLPGNPVSCMVAFYQFVRPAIHKMMGRKDLFLPQVEAVLEEDTYTRAGRRHYARALTRYQDGQYYVRLTGAQGSGILTSMTQANSFLILPEEGGEFKTGERLQVQLLPGSYLN